MASIAGLGWVLVSLLAGVALGLITGLVPGLHVNVVASLLVAAAATPVLSEIPLVAMATFIVAVAVTQAFLDIVPSLFLGVPMSEEFALLPTHRLVRDGRGVEALQLSLAGSWYGLLISVALTVVLFTAQESGRLDFEEAHVRLQPYLFALIAGISLVLVLTEQRRLWAAAVFAMSGLYGMLLFSTSLVPGGADAAFGVLFPALSGLFGLSGLLLSLLDEAGYLPEQRTDLSFKASAWLPAAGQGTLGGVAVGLLPGLGGANVATLFSLMAGLGRGVARERAEKSFIVTTSAINIGDTLFGIAALYFLGRARSGASVAIEQLLLREQSGGPQAGGLGGPLLLYIAGVALVAGVAARFLLKGFGLRIGQGISRLSHRGLALAVIGFITVMVFFTTGWGGLWILAGTTLLGMVAPVAGVRRAQAMGLFLVPVMLYYSGHQAAAVSALGLEAIDLPAPQVTVGEVLRALAWALACTVPLYGIGHFVNLRRLFLRNR